MQKLNFAKVVDQIVLEDARYEHKAYEFVREGLDFTLKGVKKSKQSTSTHVSGSELLEGLRSYTLNEFGPMGKIVLNEWGIHTCRDFGNIVFNLVNHGVLGKNDNDSIDDFSELWSFEDAFVQPFLPKPEPDHSPRRVTSPTANRRVKSSKKSVAQNNTTGEES